MFRIVIHCSARVFLRNSISSYVGYSGAVFELKENFLLIKNKILKWILCGSFRIKSKNQSKIALI